MIMSKTPLRICFFSGGSDLPAFYAREPGASLSATIDKSVHVCVHETSNIGIKIMYDTVEVVPEIDAMEHLITKETLKHFGLSKELTIASISDILSRGSGLGSSSSFTVGLVKAIAKMQGKRLNKTELAELACEIEMIRCGYPVGKQDQYAAAYGGFNMFTFNCDGSVNAEPLTDIDAPGLASNLLLVYSGRGRSANAILQKQQASVGQIDKFNLIKKGRDKAFEGRRLLKAGNHDDFGRLLHEAWIDKKSLVKEISETYFDNIYTRAYDAGALGGKLLGAGGGGFFLFYVTPERREHVVNAIMRGTDCKIYDFSFSYDGSKITSK
jgi:D-glycero-alpha-D-manno-heptose-7-phosphate kinase